MFLFLFYYSFGSNVSKVECFRICLGMRLGGCVKAKANPSRGGPGRVEATRGGGSKPASSQGQSINHHTRHHYGALPPPVHMHCSRTRSPIPSIHPLKPRPSFDANNDPAHQCPYNQFRDPPSQIYLFIFNFFNFHLFFFNL